MQKLSEHQSHLVTPPAVLATVASFYDISTSAGVALSHLLGANPSISATTTLQDFLADGLNRPIRVPSFCQVPTNDNVGHGATCTGYGTIPQSTACFTGWTSFGVPSLSSSIFTKLNIALGINCDTDTLVAGVSYCIKGKTSNSLIEDYEVSSNCAIAYTVGLGDTCAYIASASSVSITPLRLATLNTVTLLDGTIYSECSHAGCKWFSLTLISCC